MKIFFTKKQKILYNNKKCVLFMLQDVTDIYALDKLKSENSELMNANFYVYN